MTALMLRDAHGRPRRMLRADTYGAPGAPLPVQRCQAIEIAAELRAAGANWISVAVVMDLYHGWPLTEQTWMSAVRKWFGAPQQSRVSAPAGPDAATTTRRTDP